MVVGSRKFTGKMFPWVEFRGLVNKVIEIIEDPGSTNESRSGGRAMLHGVYYRVEESLDTDLIARVDAILKQDIAVKAKKPNSSLRELIVWISRETNPGSVFVLKRTDKLGDREMQESAIREHFASLGHADISLWFAPERSGQKKPAMVFIGFTTNPPSDTPSSLLIREKSIACSRFNYDA